jgi:ABC-type bacteriocin/lantibiotic exporter with double-glycine peptidase domain
MTSTVASLVHVIHLNIEVGLLFQSSALGNFLLLTLAFDFLRDKVLVRLQAALDMDLELDNVVQHTLELGVQFFADGG